MKRGQNFRSLRKYEYECNDLEIEIASLEKDIKRIKVEDEEETQTGIKFTSFWHMHEFFSRSVPVLVANVCMSYEDEDKKIKHQVRLHGLPISYIVDLDRSRFLPSQRIATGTRVGLNIDDYSIREVLPPMIGAFAQAVRVIERPTTTFEDLGGYEEQIKKLKEVYMPTLRQIISCSQLNFYPPKGCLLFGEPGTGKTLCAKALANASRSSFVHLMSTQLVQKFIGEGARLVREVFDYARTQRSCIIFIDEVSQKIRKKSFYLGGS